MVSYPNDDDRFGPSPSLWTLADAIRTDLVEWFPEYLAAHERQIGQTAGTFPPIRFFDIRYAAFVRPEDVPPAGVIWINGVRDHAMDPDRYVTASVEVGVMIVSGGATAEGIVKLTSAYVATVRDLLLQRRTARGTCQRLELVDEDPTPISPLERGRALAGYALSYVAHQVPLGRRGTGPPPDADPREDPTQPWPGDGVFETADVTVVPTNDPLS